MKMKDPKNDLLKRIERAVKLFEKESCWNVISINVQRESGGKASFSHLFYELEGNTDPRGLRCHKVYVE